VLHLVITEDDTLMASAMCVYIFSVQECDLLVCIVKSSVVCVHCSQLVDPCVA
jgi:hypothetical protein